MTEPATIASKYGIFTERSKQRLDLTYDYEDSAILAFARSVAALDMSHFVDIGANIGCYSIYVSGVASVRKILAFEPAPHAFEELKKNILLQERKDIFSPFPLALSDHKKQTTFRIVSEMSGANRIEDDTAGGNYIEVQCEPLDSLLPIKNKKIALKIDVEGHELQTLAGMENLLKNNACFIQVECLEEALAAKCKRILQTLGYRFVFSLRDDYIFLSQTLADSLDAIQNIYFKAVQDDLNELLALKTYKRQTVANSLNMLLKNGYPYDPVLR